MYAPNSQDVSTVLTGFNVAVTVLQHVADIAKRHQDLVKEIDSLIASASALNIILDETSAVTVDRPAAAFDDHMEYARLTMEKDFLDSFAGANGAYLAAVSGAIGQEMIARLQNTQSRDKVLQRLEALQAKLGIDSAWTVESEDFKVNPPDTRRNLC